MDAQPAIAPMPQMKPMVQHWYQKKWVQLIFIFAIVILLLANFTNVGLNIYTHNNQSDTIQSQIDVINTALNLKLNNIVGDIISTRNRLTVIESKLGITPPPIATFVGTREKMTSPSYLQELNLFKSLSSIEQGEYLNLSKTGKVAKYGYAFQ